MRPTALKRYLIGALLLASCAKVKVDTNLPNYNTLKTANSSIRIVALTGANQVSMLISGFNINLTPNLLVNDLLQCASGVQVGGYGPVPVPVPAKLLDQGGNAHIQLITQVASSGIADASTFTRDTVLPDNPANPTDYYVFPISETIADPNYNIIGIPRSTTPPVNPSNIKIRIINFGNPVDTFHRTGPITLTYVDGTPVSTLTSGVPQGVASGYVEIPYGTYRFRVFNQAGIELPETLTPAPYPYGNNTSSIRSYQPGGVYTIFINTNNIYLIGPCNPFSPIPTNNEAGNSFTVIPDVTPPANISFGKVQFVNAIPGKSCSLYLDNVAVGSHVPYKGVSDYQALSIGNYSLQLVDDQGNTLARQNLTLTANDNYTAWAYVNNGQPAIAVCYNDLSNPNTGQKIRFMNFSQDVPYITMTHAGQLIPMFNPSYRYPQTSLAWFYPDINDPASGADATQNLAIGVPANYEAFTEFTQLTSSLGPQYPVNVYQSSAGPPPFVPGVILPSVQPLQAVEFVVNPATYQAGDQVLSVGEQGVYTVALTGAVNTGISGTKATDTLLIVKHFK